MVDDERFAIQGCEEDGITAHNQDARQQRCMWEKHLKRTKGTRQGGILVALKDSVLQSYPGMAGVNTQGRCCDD